MTAPSFDDVDPRDTSPEARAVQLGIFRRMTGEERGHLVFEMSEEMRRIALAGLAQRRPDLDEAGLVAAYVEMLHGRLR